MKFCSECGNTVELRIPRGDTRPRYVCNFCATIHYRNPKMVVGCLVAVEDGVLLCRRAIAPQLGLWTLPAGFLESGESAEEGACRETFEEANAVVALTGLYGLFSLPEIDQIYLIFKAYLTAPAFSAGEESLEVAVFSENEIPWGQLAFTTVEHMLKRYFEDRRRGQFELYTTTIHHT